MTPSDWHDLHNELIHCPWFAHCGEATEGDQTTFIRRVHSWPEAVQWAEAEISLWCINEASNVLTWFLHTHHRQEYQEWNRHIDSFRSALDELLGGPVTAALPAEARIPGVLKWIRGQLICAYVECVYSPLSDVRLACRQVDWYLAGHFPCGWYVETEAGFPDRAITIVY